jgi:hypothetical protein
VWEQQLLEPQSLALRLWAHQFVHCIRWYHSANRIVSDYHHKQDYWAHKASRKRDPQLCIECMNDNQPDSGISNISIPYILSLHLLVDMDSRESDWLY